MHVIIAAVPKMGGGGFYDCFLQNDDSVDTVKINKRLRWALDNYNSKLNGRLRHDLSTVGIGVWGEGSMSNLGKRSKIECIEEAVVKKWGDLG